MPSSLPKNTQIGFRLLRPLDAVSLHEIRRQAIQECAAYFGTPPEMELSRGVEYYRKQLQRGRFGSAPQVLGGWIDQELVAMAGIRRRKLPTGAVGLITSMYVRDAWRSRGIGRLLLQHSLERISSLWQLQRCQMNVEVGNEKALALYQRQGFRILNREENAFSIGGTPHAVYLLERTEGESHTI